MEAPMGSLFPIRLACAAGHEAAFATACENCIQEATGVVMRIPREKIRPLMELLRKDELELAEELGRMAGEEASRRARQST